MDKESKEKVANLLRIARKAKAVAMGRIAVEKAINKKETTLIFAGKKDNNFMRKRAKDCLAKGIIVSHLFDDNELGDIFGRQKLTLVAVIDKNFTKGINEILVN
ncbi:MAG: 50S ribosomal protein L7ae [Candidatus Cloacimonetes bacterium]|nr:50S ribosomal protein L7ae [Candidatus Cloacimonadota bacterium]